MKFINLFTITAAAAASFQGAVAHGHIAGAHPTLAPRQIPGVDPKAVSSYLAAASAGVQAQLEPLKASLSAQAQAAVSDIPNNPAVKSQVSQLSAALQVTINSYKSQASSEVASASSYLAALAANASSSAGLFPGTSSTPGQSALPAPTVMQTNGVAQAQQPILYGAVAAVGAAGAALIVL